MPSKKAVYFDDPASDAGQEDANGSRSGSSPGEGVEGEVQQLAGKDNRNVFIWKTTVMIIIGFAGALVSTGIFFYLKLQEQHEIRDSVRTYSYCLAWQGHPRSGQIPMTNVCCSPRSSTCLPIQLKTWRRFKSRLSLTRVEHFRVPLRPRLGHWA